mgnify:CR=1 FL=1
MKKSGLHSAKPFLILLAGVIILFLLGQFLRFRIDLTEEKRFSLHPATKELLEKLDRPLHVDILLTGENLPGGMRRLQKSIEETVRTFNAHSNEAITVSYFDPLTVIDSLQEDFIYTLADYGINPTNVFSNQNAGQQTQLIFPGILVADDEYETGALILKGERGMSPDQILNTSIENLEFELSNAIRKLVDPEKGAVAMIIGHGELSEDDGFGEDKMSSFGAEVFGRYYWTAASQFSVFGEVGVGFGNAKEEDSFGNEQKFNAFGVNAGVGVSYFLNSNFAIEAGWAGLGYNTDDNGGNGAEKTNNFGLNVDLSSINFGLVYKF